MSLKTLEKGALCACFASTLVAVGGVCAMAFGVAAAPIVVAAAAAVEAVAFIAGAGTAMFDVTKRGHFGQ